MYVSLFPRTVQVGHLEDYRKEGVGGGGKGRGGEEEEMLVAPSPKVTSVRQLVPLNELLYYNSFLEHVLNLAFNFCSKVRWNSNWWSIGGDFVARDVSCTRCHDE